MVYLVVIFLIISIVSIATHNYNKHTEKQNEQVIDDIKNRFYNNDTVIAWAEEMAKGGTITKPTFALIGEAGYSETVIPNTSWGVRPLASMIAEEMGSTKSGGVVVTGNTFVVRNDQDITRVANQLNNMISRQTGGRL